MNFEEEPKDLKQKEKLLYKYNVVFVLVFGHGILSHWMQQVDQNSYFTFKGKISLKYEMLISSSLCSFSPTMQRKSYFSGIPHVKKKNCILETLLELSFACLLSKMGRNVALMSLMDMLITKRGGVLGKNFFQIKKANHIFVIFSFKSVHLAHVWYLYSNCILKN